MKGATPMQETTKENKMLLIAYCDRHLTAKQEEKTQFRYICPFCNSGAKGKHTSAFRIVKSNPILYKCDSCGTYGDIYNLIMHLENVSFTDAKRILQNEFALTDDAEAKNQEPIKQYTPREPKPLEHITPIEKTLDRIANFNNLQANKRILRFLTIQRGINEATLKNACIGYDKIKHCITIPFYPYKYVLNYYPFVKDTPKYIAESGQQPFYNEQAFEKAQEPIFICEGIFDALSIIQQGYEAIALCGIGNKERFIKYIHDNEITNPLILFLDFEREQEKKEIVKQAQQEIIEGLYSTNVLLKNNVCEFIYNNLGCYYKDANELLQIRTKKNKTQIDYKCIKAFENSLKRNYEEATKLFNDPRVRYNLK